MESLADKDCPLCWTVIVVLCIPSSADVSARAVTMFMPEMAKKPVVSLTVSVPVNCEPSCDMVTFAVASTVPTGALSVIVGLGSVSVSATGSAVKVGWLVWINCPPCQTHHTVSPRTYSCPPLATAITCP